MKFRTNQTLLVLDSYSHNSSGVKKGQICIWSLQPTQPLDDVGGRIDISILVTSFYR